jgi:glycerol-3-phosphate dehydrogenase (NAD(P)+)
MKTTVFGVGAWGTTLAGILAENGHDVVMWSHDPEIARTINEEHENKALFAGVKLSDKIRATTDLKEACVDSKIVVFVVASQFYASTVQKAHPFLPRDVVIVSATKGLNPADNRRPSEVLIENLPPEMKTRVAVLSGPNIAREIALKKPATTVIASPNEEIAKAAQKFFSTPYFRVYTNTDMAASELGGTLKNVIAIAAGIVDGLDLGDNTKSALMVRGLVEIIRFGTHFGAKADSFYGLAGMGDLITTCSSKMSRNHFVGESLAQGKTLKDILAGMTAVAEGVEAARHVHEIAQKEKIEMPVTTQVYKVLFEDKPVKQAIMDLMTRDLKAE